MKIINTGLFYFGTSGTAYHGKIVLSKREFNKAIKSIMRNPHISRNYQGSGKYAYLSKDLLKEDIAKGQNGEYSLRVSVTDYIVKMFKNTSRYHYKRNNYIVVVK